MASDRSRANALAIGAAIVTVTLWSSAFVGIRSADRSLVPPLAVLLGWLLLGEIPPLLALPGGLLCLAGVAVARTPGRVRRGEVAASSSAA